MMGSGEAVADAPLRVEGRLPAREAPATSCPLSRVRRARLPPMLPSPVMPNFIAPSSSLDGYRSSPSSASMYASEKVGNW